MSAASVAGSRGRGAMVGDLAPVAGRERDHGSLTDQRAAVPANGMKRGRAATGVKLGAVAEYLRGSLWFVPSVMVVAAIALALWLNGMGTSNGSATWSLAFPGGADGARAILQAVAGSVITVTGVVFSLTIVTLQLASTQFSPRLLRTFLRAPSNQVVLGTFLATFAYSLVALRGVRSGATPDQDVVPAVGVSVAYVMALASVAALVFFIDHIARSIRIDALMHDVELDASAVIDAVHPAPFDSGDGDGDVPALPAERAAVPAARSGFVGAVATDALLAAAVAHDVVVRVEPLVGGPVVAGAPLAWVWRADGHGRPASTDALCDPVNDAIQIGFERTMQQDVGYGLRQLVDIAVKALSPGINDPTTAVHAILHLASLLSTLAGRDLRATVRQDDRGVVRVVVPATDLAGHLDLVCGQIRRYGAHEPAVVAQLVRMLRDIVRGDGSAPHVTAIQAEARRLVTAAERAVDDPHDVAAVLAAAAELDDAIAGAAGRGHGRS